MKSYVLLVLLLFLSTVCFCLGPNLCDKKGTVQCDDFATCCLFANKQHGCCPFIRAICCPGTDHCCPPGFSCTTTGCARL